VVVITEGPRDGAVVVCILLEDQLGSDRHGGSRKIFHGGCNIRGAKS
jgi:hypothetical protein